ncbi:MAG: sulfatase-like hydrolase/transferase, partial [Candidatus Fonsibacter sp.]
MVLSVCCVFVVETRGVQADGNRRPNFIFILTDDQGWGDAGFAGHPYVRTPALDRLKREGTW